MGRHLHAQPWASWKKKGKRKGKLCICWRCQLLSFPLAPALGLPPEHHQLQLLKPLTVKFWFIQDRSVPGSLPLVHIHQRPPLLHTDHLAKIKLNQGYMLMLVKQCKEKHLQSITGQSSGQEAAHATLLHLHTQVPTEVLTGMVLAWHNLT